jgi:hypothetical protein
MQRTVHVTTYAEFTDDLRSWKSPRPDFDVARFNKELEKRAGTIGSVPRFRLRWAGECAEYIIEEGLVLTGFMYLKDGIETFVPLSDKDFEFPDKSIPAPFYEDLKVFTPRWVIEQYIPDRVAYEKAWFVQEVSQTVAEGEGGRVDVMSYYREPAEIDIQMATQVTYLNTTLRQSDITDGLNKLKQLQERAEFRKKEEFVDEIAQETVRAFTDGFAAKPILFDMGKKFNIREYSKKKIEEHNAKV